ncbi:MAG: VWA domain-containing protein [Pyrinomonadaceae bacterium]
MKKSILHISAFLAFALNVFGQSPTIPPPPPPLVINDSTILKIDSRLIMVPVSVTDGRGNAVKGLSNENFRVSEDGKTQEITDVSPAEDVPLEIALLFDVSASTDPMFKFEQETAAKFLQVVMRPQDRATIFTIGEKPVIVQTRNVANVSIATINSIMPTKQFTAFFDTVSAAARYLNENAPPKSRKVILAITDGEDTNSDGIREGFADVYKQVSKDLNNLDSKKLRELYVEKRDQIKDIERKKSLKFLQDSDVVFYSINPAGSSIQLNKMSQFGQTNMEVFANATGGTAYLPRFLPTDLKSEFESGANIQKNINELNGIFLKLGNELQSQYLVQYYSDNEFPLNTYVNVELKVLLSLPQGVKSRARAGYYVK